MILRPLFFALLPVALVIAGAAGAADDDNPIVVELFTSQGCSSCPPADRFLGDLAKEPGILALSFHVDYWDYIGWKDPFAKHWATLRQRDYGRTFDIGYVYTPQMVVQGSAQAVGSDRSDIEAEIAQHQQTRPPHPSLRIERREDGSLAVQVGAAGAQEPATVWLVCYDRHHETEVPRGENAGTRLVNYDVVRHFEAIGSWKGDAITLTVSADEAAEYLGSPNGAIAVLLQSAGTGPILAAARLR